MKSLVQTALPLMILLLASFTAVMAMLVIVFTFSSFEGGLIWNLLRLAICAVIIVVALVTWWHLRFGDGVATEWLLLLASMGLLVLGAFGVAWAIRVGDLTGDYEYWVRMIDMALVGQGALSILHLWGRRHSLAAG